MLWRRTSLLTLSMGLGRIFGQMQGAPASGVDQLVQQAFAHNREILAARQRVAEARGLLRQAGVRPVSTIEVNAGSGRPLGTTGEEEYTIGYSRPLETAGKRSKRVALAEQGLQLAEAELAELRRQLAYDIKVRYIDAAANHRKTAAIESIVTVNRASYRLIDARVERGDAAPLERQLLLVELNRAEAQKATAVGQAESARLALRQSMGIPPGANDEAKVATLPPDDVVANLDDVRKRALENRPDLRLAGALESQSGAELALTEAQSRPDLTASAQYARRYSQFEDPLRRTGSGSPLLLQDRDNILTLGISIPLQSRRRNEGNIEAAVARQRAAGLRRQHLEVTIPLEAEAAWRRYQAAKTAVGILNRGVLDESRRNLLVIRQAYDLGQLRLLDVLNEQRRLLETELSFVDAEAELARSIAELERTVGGSLK
ncbi:TolC family protein [uncultured Paludibaculum sp.]|uniref:TolC family protein n=1 Tax=uncultured Paludibaculum sp. TaxID=1765020 RepID=UPI002AAAA47E|nr:TolC family protein [uncultured Paludibaculum sp.]